MLVDACLHTYSHTMHTITCIFQLEFPTIVQCIFDVLMSCLMLLALLTTVYQGAACGLFRMRDCLCLNI